MLLNWKIATEQNNGRFEIERSLDGIGQLINAYNENLSGGNNIFSLKIAGTTSGNYMVRFKDSEGRVLQTQSFIVK